MNITGTLINYYFHCHRQVWLFAKKVVMEQNEDAVRSGRFISENTYERERHELRIGDMVLDFYDRKTHTVNEVKRSSKMKELHIVQVQFYIYKLELLGINGVKGRIRYPSEKITIEVPYGAEEKEIIIKAIKGIEDILALPAPPPVIVKPFCPKCAYFDLCYS